MNIFVLSTDPKEAAQFQIDKHVVKMVLESAQLLCAVLREDNPPYKPTHLHHPCTKWAETSAENYQWLLDHAKALAEEYTYRYGKVHKSAAVIQWCEANKGRIVFPATGLTPFAQAMPDECKHEDPVTAYRSYYQLHKAKFANWTKREKPNWWTASTKPVNST